STKANCFTKAADAAPSLLLLSRNSAADRSRELLRLNRLDQVVKRADALRERSGTWICGTGDHDGLRDFERSALHGVERGQEAKEPLDRRRRAVGIGKLELGTGPGERRPQAVQRRRQLSSG